MQTGKWAGTLSYAGTPGSARARDVHRHAHVTIIP